MNILLWQLHYKVKLYDTDYGKVSSVLFCVIFMGIKVNIEWLSEIGHNLFLRTKKRSTYVVDPGAYVGMVSKWVLWMVRTACFVHVPWFISQLYLLMITFSQGALRVSAPVLQYPISSNSTMPAVTLLSLHLWLHCDYIVIFISWSTSWVCWFCICFIPVVDSQNIKGK